MPSKKKKYNARFPPARIKKIMQTDEDVGKVAAAVPVIISRALELFIDSLIEKTATVTKGKNAKTLSTSHVKQAIHSEKTFDFLRDLVVNVPDHQAEEDGDNPTPSGSGTQERKPKVVRQRKPREDGARGPGRPRKVKVEEKKESSTETDEATETDEEISVNKDPVAPPTTFTPPTSTVSSPPEMSGDNLPQMQMASHMHSQGQMNELAMESQLHAAAMGHHMLQPENQMAGPDHTQQIPQSQMRTQPPAPTSHTNTSNQTPQFTQGNITPNFQSTENCNQSLMTSQLPQIQGSSQIPYQMQMHSQISPQFPLSSQMLSQMQMSSNDPQMQMSSETPVTMQASQGQHMQIASQAPPTMQMTSHAPSQMQMMSQVPPERQVSPQIPPIKGRMSPKVPFQNQMSSQAPIQMQKSPQAPPHMQISPKAPSPHQSSEQDPPQSKFPRQTPASDKHTSKQKPSRHHKGKDKSSQEHSGYGAESTTQQRASIIHGARQTHSSNQPSSSTGTHQAGDHISRKQTATNPSASHPASLGSVPSSTVPSQQQQYEALLLAQQQAAMIAQSQSAFQQGYPMHNMPFSPYSFVGGMPQMMPMPFAPHQQQPGTASPTPESMSQFSPHYMHPQQAAFMMPGAQFGDPRQSMTQQHPYLPQGMPPGPRQAERSSSQKREAPDMPLDMSVSKKSRTFLAGLHASAAIPAINESGHSSDASGPQLSPGQRVPPGHEQQWGYEQRGSEQQQRLSHCYEQQTGVEPERTRRTNAPHSRTFHTELASNHVPVSQMCTNSTGAKQSADPVQKHGISAAAVTGAAKNSTNVEHPRQNDNSALHKNPGNINTGKNYGPNEKMALFQGLTNIMNMQPVKSYDDDDDYDT